MGGLLQLLCSLPKHLHRYTHQNVVRAQTLSPGRSVGVGMQTTTLLDTGCGPATRRTPAWRVSHGGTCRA